MQMSTNAKLVHTTVINNVTICMVLLSAAVIRILVFKMINELAYIGSIYIVNN